MSHGDDVLMTARAEALFVSAASTGARLTREEVSQAVSDTVRAHHGVRRCAADMAFAFGESPETAALRMRWALQTLTSAYGNHRQPSPRHEERR